MKVCPDASWLTYVTFPPRIFVIGPFNEVLNAPDRAGLSYCHVSTGGRGRASAAAVRCRRPADPVEPGIPVGLARRPAA